MALITPKSLSLLPSDNSTVIRPEIFKEGFTQSEIGVWDNCAEQWYLGYNHMLKRKGTFEWYFIYGDGVHSTLQSWYKDGNPTVARLQFPSDVIPTREQQFELEKWQAILEVQMERYFIRYEDDLDTWTPWANEEVVATEFEGIKLTGKLDLGFSVDGVAGNILSDHKTYNLEDTIGWQFRFQFMFYIWLAQRALGHKIQKFLVNGIKKPQLRQGKDESLPSFIIRIRSSMIQEPDKYFQRTPLLMIAHSMEHFESRVLRPKIERIKAVRALTQGKGDAMIVESLVRNQNTNNCVKYGSCCQFLPICQHGYNREAAFYTRRQTKHEELEAQ